MAGRRQAGRQVRQAAARQAGWSTWQAGAARQAGWSMCTPPGVTGRGSQAGRLVDVGGQKQRKCSQIDVFDVAKQTGRLPSGCN